MFSKCDRALHALAVGNLSEHFFKPITLCLTRHASVYCSTMRISYVDVKLNRIQSQCPELHTIRPKSSDNGGCRTLKNCFKSDLRVKSMLFSINHCNFASAGPVLTNP